jgi:hypothetical protein
MFPDTIADPTLKSSTKNRRSQCSRNERLILHIFPLTHYKRTWRKTQVETSQYSARPQGRKGRHYYIEGNHKPTSS